MIPASVHIDGFDELWTTGEGGMLTDLWVSIGQGKSGTSCQVTIADPTHKTAAKLIEHTLANGGIQPLVQPTSAPTADASGQPINVVDGVAPKGLAENRLLIVKTCLANGVTDDGQIAYILATAEHETGKYAHMVEQGSRAYFQYLEGRRDIGNDQPGDGYKYRGRGYVQVTGKLTYGMWSKKLGIDAVATPEKLAEPRYAAQTLVIGMRDGMYANRKPISFYCNGSKRDFYNARSMINGDKGKNGQKIANEATAILKEVPSLKAQAGGTTAVKAVATETQAGQPSQTSPEVIVKGGKLIVTIGDVSFEFFHQGTKPSDSGSTVIVGQDVRWVLNRRQRSKTEQGVSLKQLAERVALAHKVKLAWLAPEDFTYTHIDQSGISDYQLLQRECDRCGLFLSSVNNVITVKSLANLVDSAYVLYPGLNLISWDIEDKALTDEAEDASSSMLQSENKVELDIASGQLTQTKPDVDTATSKDVTGSPVAPATGSISQEQAGLADSMRSRTKRLKGLPSKFTIPLDNNSLMFEPLWTVLTEGLPGVLSRIWCVDKVEHRLAEGHTVLHCYSPVEVLDNTTPTDPAQPAPITGKPTATGYIRPVSGYPVTSRCAKIRNIGTSPHCGEDVGTPIGIPVVAMNDGVVEYAKNIGAGGNCIAIRHTDGGTSRCMHLSAMFVKAGDSVQRAKVIGRSGNTGGVAAHLHWDLQGYPKDQFKTGSRTFNKPSAVGLANLTEGQMT